MASEDSPAAAPVQWQGKDYKPLADGKYDVIILGTGLKECVLSGLLSIKGKKVRALRCASSRRLVSSLTLFSSAAGVAP
jgi:uncharacterized protein (DUF1810 family)